MATQADVTELALSLPHTTEKPSYGAPGFRVKAQLFARIRNEDGFVVCWVDGLEEKAAMLAAEPAKFTTTPHYDGHPTVLLQPAALERDELLELLTESWLLRAPVTVRRAFEAARGAQDRRRPHDLRG